MTTVYFRNQVEHRAAVFINKRVQQGLRRSVRLQRSGYYDKDGRPTISYREQRNKVFTERIEGKIKQKGNDPSYEGSDSSDSLFNFSDTSSFSGCRMFNRRQATYYTWKWSLFTVFILSLVFPLIFYGVISTIRLFRPAHKGQTITSSPHIFEDMTMKHTEKLQAELDHLKKKLNFWFPDVNLWSNFALESHGAKVHKKRSSSSYDRIEGIKIFGIPIFSKSSPVTVIQGNHPPIPGKCWAFPGSQGNLFIELSHTVIVSHVTLDHVLTSALPTDAILSAPRDFSVYGLQSLEGEAILLGTFTFDLGGDPTQTFAVKVDDVTAFKFINLKFEANYGHADYTCLYGFRVHGRI